MLSNLLRTFLNLASLPTDRQTDRLRKSAFLLVHGFYVFLSVSSIGFHILTSSPIGIITYSVTTIIGVLLIAFVVRTRRFILYVNLALTHISLTHLSSRVLEGGYRSGYMPWFILVPLAATILLSRRQMVGWWAFFVAAEGVLAILNPVVQANAPDQPVSSTLNYALSIIPVVTVLALAFRHLVQELEEARRQADSLLLNILPEPIADQLKQNRATIADRHEEITVLFADIVDFTRLSANADPVQIVNMLNTIFSEFDDLAEKHGLEKIKTIGDAYMVAGGLPVPRPDHAEAVAEMALDMLEALQHHRGLNGDTIRVRIGINTGPVVAGVIGRQKFIYDLWGDAVNTASRMESNGVADVIQVTQSTRDKLDERYVFQEREPIEVKGKGRMVTYLLEHRRATHAETT